MAGSLEPRAAVLFGPPINWNESRSDADTVSLAAYKPRYEIHKPASGQMRASLATSDRSIGASFNSDQIRTATRPASNAAAYSSSMQFDDDDDTLSQSSYRPVGSRRAASSRIDQHTSSSLSKSKTQASRKHAGLDDSAALKGSIVVAHYEYLEGMRKTTPVKTKASPAVSAGGVRQPTTPRSASKRMSDTRYSLRKARPATSETSSVDTTHTSTSCRSSAVSHNSKSARNGLNSPLVSSRVHHRLRPASNAQQTAAEMTTDERSSAADLKEPTSARSEQPKKTPRGTPRSNVSLRQQPKREVTQRPEYHRNDADCTRDQNGEDADSVYNSLLGSRDRYSSKKSTKHPEPSGLRASDVSIGHRVTSVATMPDEGADLYEDTSCSSNNAKGLPPLCRVDDALDQDNVWSKLLQDKLRESQPNPFIPGPRAVRNSQDLFQYRSSPQQQEDEVDIQSVSLEFPKLSASHPLSGSEDRLQQQAYATSVDGSNAYCPKLAGQDSTFRISEEKADFRISEENAHYRISEDTAGVRDSDAAANFKSSQDKANLKRSGEKADVRTSDAAANVKRSEDKGNVKRSGVKAAVRSSDASAKDSDAGNATIVKVDTDVVEVQAISGAESDQEEIVVYKHPTHNPAESPDKPGCKCCCVM